MDKLQFYYHSADKPVGDGVGETVADRSQYLSLSKIPNWRRILSTLDGTCEFAFRGKTYKSVEHALQAMKFIHHPDISNQFSLESGTTLAHGTGLSAHRARKIKLLSVDELTNWDECRHAIKDEIYKCKYSSGIPRAVLLGTGNAELWSYGPRLAKIRATSLERVRTLLQLN